VGFVLNLGIVCNLSTKIEVGFEIVLKNLSNY